MVMDEKSVAFQWRNCHAITRMAKATSDALTKVLQRLFMQFQAHANSLSFCAGRGTVRSAPLQSRRIIFSRLPGAGRRTVQLKVLDWRLAQVFLQTGRI